MILVIDNFDSFVYNLARYFALLGCETHVVRNDAIDVAEIRQLQPQAIVLSPGPGSPSDAGRSVEIVQELHQEVPMLGVCLGHQTIAAALGGRVVRATEPRHGRTSPITHNAVGLFAGLTSPLTVCRYHSLLAEPTSLPESLVATAHTNEGVIMALKHLEHPVYGVQFHPEAILTEGGFTLLANFLRMAGIAVPHDPAALAAAEDRSPIVPPPVEPNQPVTF